MTSLAYIAAWLLAIGAAIVAAHVVEVAEARAEARRGNPYAPAQRRRP